jgi:Electron transfer DM13
MGKKKTIIIGIAVVIAAIPLGVYTLSPLFLDTEIHEPPPTVTNNNNDESVQIQQFEDFMTLSEVQRMEKGHQMSIQEKEMIMKAAAQTNGTAVNEDMTAIGIAASTVYVGTFVGVNDGLHNSEGQAKVLKLSDGSNFLRLENFRSTNGPDLYVYLSTDKNASDFVNLGRLKGNVGDQNYEIPDGTDISKYDTALIWCQAFSVLFGSAELEPVITSS